MKKTISILMSIVLLLGIMPMNAFAEGLGNNQYAVHYDDARDKKNEPQAQVKLGDNLLERDRVNDFTEDQELKFNLVKPDFRQDDTPIVKIWVHSNPEEYYSNTDANDDAHKIILQNDSFTFTPTSAAPFDINVAWSEYDAFGSTDEKPVLIEMECTGEGSAEVKDIESEDKFVSENWSKYRLSDSSIIITWTGDAPREIRVDGMEPIKSFNGNSHTINLPDRTDNFYYIQVEFNEGEREPDLENNQYAVHFDDARDENNVAKAQVKLGDVSLGRDSVNGFTTEQLLEFKLVKPEDRRDATPIVEICVHSNPKVIYRSDANDEDPKITLNGDSFTFTPTSADPFDINIWWSAYDEFGSTHDKPVLIEMECTGKGSAEVQNIASSDDKFVSGNWSKYRLSGSEITIKWTDDAPREIRVDGMEPIKSFNGNSHTINLPDRTDNFYYIRVEFNEGEQDSGPGGPDESGRTNYEGAKAYIENGHFAYYGKTSAEIESYLEWQLWYDMFGQNGSHFGDYYGMICETEGNNSSVPQAFKDALTVDRTQKSDSIIPKVENPTLPSDYLSYYEFKITLKPSEEDKTAIVASGKVYILPDPKNVIIGFSKGGVAEYKIVEDATVGVFNDTSVVGNYDCGPNGDPNIVVFGNGADIVGAAYDKEERGSEYIAAWHVTTDHSNDPINNVGSDDKKIGFKLVVYNQTFEGLAIEGNSGAGGKGNAKAWGWSELNKYPTTGTSADSPSEFNVYVGNTELSISPLTFGNSMPIDRIDCTLQNADKAVYIEKQNDGTFKIVPLSGFYDTIPLKITYTNGTDGYITFHLVAIDICFGEAPNGSSTFDIFHGTDESTPVTLSKGEAIVAASFYYPEGVSSVDLFVTYTWADRSVTRKIISAKLAHTAETEEFVAVDDFVLWRGNRSEAPVQVSCTPIRDGGSQDTFGGALIGSGAGVKWTKPTN